MPGTFYGIGVGPGDAELMTLKAIRILTNIDILALPESAKDKSSVAYQIAYLYLKKETKRLVLTFPMTGTEDEKRTMRLENALKIKEQLDNGLNVAFITLGDPMIYSTYIYLVEQLQEMQVKIITIPGITSFTAIAAGIGIPLAKGNEKFCIISAYDSDTEKIVELFDTIIFMKVSAYKTELLNLLKKYNGKFFLVANAGQLDEKIIDQLSDFENEEISYFSTVIFYKAFSKSPQSLILNGNHQLSQSAFHITQKRSF